MLENHGFYTIGDDPKITILRLFPDNHLPAHADCAFAFGCTLDGETRLEPAMLAYQLYKNRIVDRVAVCGGRNPSTPDKVEGLSALQYLLQRNVPCDDIFVDLKSRHTRQNIEALLWQFEDYGFARLQSFIVIGVFWHFPRCVMTLALPLSRDVVYYPLGYVPSGRMQIDQPDFWRDAEFKYQMDVAKIPGYNKGGHLTTDIDWFNGFYARIDEQIPLWG